MNGWIEFLNRGAGTVLTAELNGLWIGAAAVALAWTGLRLAPRARAATRYWIWCGALAAVLLAPAAPRLARAYKRPHAGAAASRVTVVPLAVVPFPVASPTARIGGISPVGLAELNGRPVVIVRGESRWPLLLLGIWLAIALFQLWRLAAGWRYLRAMKRRARPMAPAWPVPVRRQVALLASDEVASPLAAGYLRPAVILPTRHLGELSPTDLDHVLLHELAHIERRDDWATLAGCAIAALWLLHPLVAFTLARIGREREMACDEFVVAHSGAATARGYAGSLARLYELRRSHNRALLAAGIFGRHGSRLGERVEALLARRGGFAARASRAGVLTSILLVTAALAVAATAPGWIGLALPRVVAQTTPAFEAASIKPGDPSSRRVGIGIEPGGRLNTSHATLRLLIAWAYDIRDSQLIGGPNWVNSDNFNIEAKGPDGPPLSPAQDRDKIRLMLQALLADRFQLTVHRETRQMDVYNLVVAKGGSKLKPDDRLPDLPPGFAGRPEASAPSSNGTTPQAAPPADASGRAGRGDTLHPGSMMMGPAGHIGAASVPLQNLAGLLSTILSTTVIDKTGLTGTYDFNLQWTPGLGERGFIPGGPDGADAPPAPDSSGPSLFTAIQAQLGLKLEAAKGPVEVLVIDHAEKPTAN